MSRLLAAVPMLGSISFDPGFRGILVVIAMVAVLCGSIWAILSTNSGVRLGVLIGLTGLFGWLLLMGIMWTMYGIGYKGPAPTWRVKEVNMGDITQAATPVARTLPSLSTLPDPIELRNSSAALTKAYPKDKKDPTLGDLMTVDPQLQKQIKEKTGKWYLLPTSDRAVGETQAVVAEEIGPTGINLFQDPSNYVIFNTFTTGGKPKRTDVSTLGRLKWKITNGLRIKNPPAYAVVQLRAAIPQETKPGQAPPLPVQDKTKPIISVVLERDLGALRLPQFGFTVFSGTMFIILANMLHRRDKAAARARAAVVAGAS